MFLKRIRSIAFHQIKKRLTGLCCTGSSFVSFRKAGMAIVFFQDAGTSVTCHRLSKLIKIVLAVK